MNARKSGSTAAGVSSARNHSACTVVIPTAAAPCDVVDEPVADEERLERVDAEAVERVLEDRRVGLARADLAREDDRVDALRDAELLERRGGRSRGGSGHVFATTASRRPRARSASSSACARAEQRARRPPRRVLGVEEAVELVVGERPEQAAQLLRVVDVARRPSRGRQRPSRNRAVKPAASSSRPSAASPAACPAASSSSSHVELDERVAPVEEDRLAPSGR